MGHGGAAEGVGACRPFSLTSDQGFATLTAHPTPFDGEHAEELAGPVYTPLWTTADHIYVGAPVNRGGVDQSRVARLDKSYVATQDEQVGLGTLNVQAGHRGTSIGVADDGQLVTHGAAHNEEWRGKHSTTPYDLTTLTATTAAVSGATPGYFRFFNDPYSDDLWLVLRGAPDGSLQRQGFLYKWNASASIWDRIGGGAVIGGTSYGGNMAFAADGTIYLTIVQHTDEGFPHRDAGIVKSVDGGAVWTNLLGVACTLPIDNSESSIVFPTAGLDRVSNVMPAVVGDTLIVLGDWQTSDTGNRSLWQAVWNPASGEFDRTFIMDGIGHISTTALTSQSGRLFAVASPTHLDGGRLWLLVNDTAGAGPWDRYVLDAGVWLGGYLDHQSYALDGVVRVLPLSEDFTSHEVWEVTVPAP